MTTVETQAPQHQQINTAKPEIMPRKGSTFTNHLFKAMFYAHLILITVLVIFLTIRAVISHRFRPKQWYSIVFSSTALSGIMAFTYQALVSFSPSTTFKATFWLSPLLTCGFGVLLILIGTPGSLAASVIAIVSSVLQSLYGCWVNPRFKHATQILTLSLKYHPPKVKTAVILSIFASVLFSSLLMSGLGGPTTVGTKIDPIFISVILFSLAWTMQIIKNILHAAVSQVKYMQFASVVELEVDFNMALKDTVKYSMGSICMGSILVPIITVIRGVARAVESVSGDSDEFLFSCAGCCSGTASRMVVYGNRWGFVHMSVYNKGIVQASMDTWEMFTRIGIEELINRDLTSSFCFLGGVAAGCVCGVVGGGWTLFVHRSYATEVSIYAFLVGYFVNRVAMAWVQASVTAYYVAYAENPGSHQFDNTIPAYMRELQRSHVQRQQV